MSWDHNAGQQVQGEAVQGGWPTGNTPVGSGIAGKVDSYTERDSTRRRGETYLIAHIAGAVEYTPTGKDKGTLSRAGDEKGVAHVIVGAWLQSLLTPERVPVGSFVQVIFDGVSPKGAKMYTVRTVDRGYMKRLHEAATKGAIKATADAAATEDGDDDLPF